MNEQVERVHFIGIGGTAMAATAAAMKERGYRVTGSDQGVYPPMSDFLEARGIEVRVPYDAKNLDPSPDLVVVGNAISRGNEEVEFTLANRLPFCSLPELLSRFFIRGKRSLVVAGTHGKTTTTSLLAWIFEHSGFNPSFLIGGIPPNLGQGARFTDSEWFIIEGDEYDSAFFDKRSKFVHYQPEVAIINNLEFDHADIFDNLAAVKKAFQHFIRLVPANGLLLANGDDPGLEDLLKVDFCPVQRMGLGASNDVRATRLQHSANGSAFRLGETTFSIPMTGEFNVRNALAAAACARYCGIGDTEIQAAFDTFIGIRRRMEEVGTANGITVIDDFGHHPTAIRETCRALRDKYPGRRLWAVFEPRSNTTRRSVFQDELAEALGLADRVVVAQVDRLEQLPEDQRLDPEILMARLSSTNVEAAYLPTVDEIVRHIAAHVRPGDAICVFSNGGFGGIHGKLLQQLAAGAVPG